MLTAQRPLLRQVIQDGIERTRASLMFKNAFPDLFATLDYIGDALSIAAEHNEAATDIHRRLLADHMYNINMSRVVSSYLLFLMLLTSYPASCTHPPFPQGSEGLLRCSDTGRVHGHPIDAWCHAAG
jgi:hypothetical protein